MKSIINLFKDIYKDRRLLISLATKDFQRKFAGSYFGIMWGFIQPLLTILVYCFVFIFGFRSGDVGSIPYVVWFISGIVPWLFISEAIAIGSNSFVEYSYLVKKVVFNINILPLVKIISSLYIHLFFVVIAVGVACIYGFYPTIYILQLVYYNICTILLVFGLTLISSSIMVFFRDLGQIINILLLIGMWGTPIAWGMSMFPERVQFLLKLNPFYYIIEGYRDSIVGGTWFLQKYKLTLYFWIVLGITLIVGTWVYNRLKPHFADTL